MKIREPSSLIRFSAGPAVSLESAGALLPQLAYDRTKAEDNARHAGLRDLLEADGEVWGGDNFSSSFQSFPL